MTRHRLVSLLAAGLLLAGVVVWFLVRQERSADPLRCLPADTLALVELRDPALLGNQLLASPLGQRLAALRWQAILEELGVAQEEAALVQARVELAQSFLSGPLFRELAGSRAVLALLPPQGQASPALTAEKLRQGLVLITQPRSSTDLMNLLAPLLLDRRQRELEMYRGIEIRPVELDEDLTLYLSVGKGLLLASFSDAMLRRSLDLRLDREPAGNRHLEGLPDYQALRRRAAGRDSVFFYRKQVGSGSAPSGLFCGDEGDRLRCTAVLQPGDTEGELPPPATDEALARLRAELVAHGWTNLLDPAGTVAALTQLPPLQEFLAAGNSWLHQKTGLTLQEFSALFDRPISCTLTEWRGSEFFPLPHFCCRLAVRDEDRLRTALASLFAGKNLAKRESAGVAIISAPLAGGLLQPSYAFRDGTILIGDSPEQIELDLTSPTEPLSESKLFRRASVGKAEADQMHAYLDYPRFGEGVRRLAAWGATLLSLTDQDQGRLALLLVDQVLNPILDGLRMFAAGSVSLLVTPGEVVMEAVLVRAAESGKEE